MKFYALLLFVGSTCAAKVFHVESTAGTYKLSYRGAHDACKLHGGHLATVAELEELRQTDFSLCKCGWTLDKTAWYPMTKTVSGCGEGPGLHKCDWHPYHWDAWCYKGDSIGNCSYGLGIETNGIHYSQLQASSEFRSWWPLVGSSRWSAQIARLHNKDLVNAWVPEKNHRNEYLGVDLDVPTAITGIVTQGASRLGRKMWVTQYLIKYSKDGEHYKTIQEDGKDKKFEGNVDNDGLKRNMFPEPVLTRHIRIYPIKYQNDMALRIELLGCDLEIYEAAQAMARDVVVERSGGHEKSPEVPIFLETPPPEK